MSAATKRTRLKAVYLTDTERDLVHTALQSMRNELMGETAGNSYWSVKFAKSFTAKRLFETAALFADKTTGEQS